MNTVKANIVLQHNTKFELGQSVDVWTYGNDIYLDVKDGMTFYLPVKPTDLHPQFYGSCWTITHEDKSFTLCNQKSELANILNPIYHDEIKEGDWSKLEDTNWF